LFYLKDFFALTKGYGTCLLLAAVKENSNSGTLLLSSGPRTMKLFLNSDGILVKNKTYPQT
jgi:hypothetical protein